MAQNPFDTLIQMPGDIISQDPLAFDHFVEGKGVLLKHYKSLPCVGTLTETDDPRNSHSGCGCTGSGWIYKFAGQFKGVFTNAPKSTSFKDIGLIDSAVAYLIVPRFYYQTNTQMYFTPYDRIDICCADGEPMLVAYTEKQNISQVGIDRLQFPIKKVEHLVDGNGIEYKEGIDFQVYNGWIKWISNHRPQFDQNVGKGKPYSIRYLFDAFWAVNRLLHETRVAAHLNPNTEQVETVRMPYQLEIIRDIYFMNQFNQNNPNNTNIRQQYPAPSGSNLT